MIKAFISKKNNFIEIFYEYVPEDLEDNLKKLRLEEIEKLK
jgi:hypothetical protein